MGNLQLHKQTEAVFNKRNN